jgi:hypothetical protein
LAFNRPASFARKGEPAEVSPGAASPARKILISLRRFRKQRRKTHQKAEKSCLQP